MPGIDINTFGKRYIEEKKYDDVDILVAFSGAIDDGGEEYTETKLNVRKDGSHIAESQTKAEFHRRRQGDFVGVKG